jgi:SAM-dependent methyltransferase
MNQMAGIEQLRAYYAATLPYYDAALEDRGDLPFWQSIARRWHPRHILDLGCGTGRVTSVLSTIAPTTGVDLLIEMLRCAMRRVVRANFVVADLRELAIASAFDLIVLADDPMAHLTSPSDRMKVMKQIADHLTPDGRVVLEGLYREPGKRMQVPRRDVFRGEQKQFTVAESWEPAGTTPLWNVTYRYEQGSKVADVATVLRSWTEEEVRRLPDAGLRVEELRGDFDERPFSREAPRIVIVARRHPS